MAAVGLLKKYSGLSTLLALELVALLMISYQIRVDERLTLLEQLSLMVFGPVQEAGDQLVDSVSGVMRERKSREELEADNARLRAEVLRLKDATSVLEETARANERYRRLLELPPRDEWEYLYAEVIGHSRRHNDHMILINKGFVHGVHVDMGVFCGEGVVGVVWEASSHYAKVMLVTNPAARVAALVQSSRYHESYVAGDGEGRGRLENFPNYEAVVLGDLITTSGLDRIFPKGMLIGTVNQAIPSQHAFQDVVLDFSADFSRLEEVVLLLPVGEEEAEHELD